MVMEIPSSKHDMARGAEAEDDGEEEEYDRVFYEDIEAPKFVDLTAPDAARPSDDHSWFCLRIGCDQNHEHVDPEALHRSFFMRVRAASSSPRVSRRGHGGEEPQRPAAEGDQEEEPEVEFPISLALSASKLLWWLVHPIDVPIPLVIWCSSMLKCPHSAPPKPPRSRIARLSTATEAADKAAAAKPRLKTHRICTLRASPTRTKAAKVEPSSARKKALTTPRSKPVRPRQEPFLSVKHQKEPVAAARKGTVVKALFMTTPKKDASQTPGKTQAAVAPPLSEVCSKMRKLNLACREVPSRYLCQSSNPKSSKKCDQTAVKCVKTAQKSRPDVKKKILGCSLQHGNSEVGKENRSGRENTAADENACPEAASSSEEPKEVTRESRIEVETSQADNCDDDDKENLSYVDQPTEQMVIISHSEGENMQHLENNENVPRKVAKMQSKLHAEQGGKLKKTTNPKPFRLRTDERRVLKEANPERHQMLTENNSMAAVQQIGRCRDGKGRDKPMCGDKQKKQIRNVASGQVDEAKRVLNSIRCNNVKPAMRNGRTVGKSLGASRVASSTRSTKITSGSMAQPSQIGKEKKTSVKLSRLQAAAA
uniref:Uncharacterized protein n=1 Tax=Oryza punctata TaxID=4537 RepID=A0A0E0KJJ2_ORYPU